MEIKFDKLVGIELSEKYPYHQKKLTGVFSDVDDDGYYFDIKSGSSYGLHIPVESIISIEYLDN